MPKIKQIQFAEGKTTNYLEDLNISLSQSIQEQMVRYASKCMQVYSGQNPEQTKVQKLYGVPSNLIRVDFSMDKPQFEKISIGEYRIDGDNFNPYETEENPRGRRVSGLINKRFGELFSKYHKPGVDNFAIISPERKLRNNYDDDQIPGYVISLEEAQKRVNSGSNVFINPIDTKEDRLGSSYPCLQEHFGTTSTSEGSKNYQVELGYAKQCSADLKLLRKGNMDQPLFFQPNKNASKAYGIYFYHPDPDFTSKISEADQRYLISEKSSIKKLGDKNLIVKNYAPAINLNELVKAENFASLENYVGIIRFYLAFCTLSKTYIPIGGVLMARPKGNIIIHGTQGSITIPVNPF